MNSQLQTTLANKLQSGWQPNPAMRTLVHDYTKYHTVLVIVGGLVLLIFVVLSIIFWVKFKRIPKLHRLKWPFEKKVYFCFGLVSTLSSLFFTLFVVANLSTALNPLPGFSLLASSTTTPSSSEVGHALDEWVRSGSATFPPVLKQKVQDRINWQRPKAVICGVLLVIFVVLSIRIWNVLIKESRLSEAKWTLKDRALIAAGIITVTLSLLLVVMTVANIQGAIGPIAISLLGVGG